MFVNKKLNSSLIMKHTLRGSDNYLFPKPRASATKIILPFSSDDLAMGGTNIFVGQKNFAQTLIDIVGGYPNEQARKQDTDLLEAIDGLPSLDPFLLRERLLLMKRQPATCYYQISQTDLRKMQEFVGQQVQGLIEMAFGDGAGGTNVKSVSGQMASKILADENAESLAPLKSALQLEGQDWIDGVYCWKGFLYYKWLFNDMVRRAGLALKGIQTARIVFADARTLTAISGMRKRGIKKIKEEVWTVSSLLKEYDTAYQKLTAQKEPSSFKTFLLKSREMFADIGASSGVINHLVGLWEFRCSQKADLNFLGEEFIEILQEFDNYIGAETGLQPNQMDWAKKSAAKN